MTDEELYLLGTFLAHLTVSGMETFQAMENAGHCVKWDDAFILFVASSTSAAPIPQNVSVVKLIPSRGVSHSFFVGGGDVC